MEREIHTNRVTAQQLPTLPNCLLRVLLLLPVPDLADEAESALAADDEVLDDLDGVVSREVHQRVQRVA
jgi:hypothetical protein